MANKVSLDQWRALVALADEGTYAAAAERLHRTASAAHDAVQRLQDVLGIDAVVVRGRSTRLTPAGQVLVRRARKLLSEADRLEARADELAEGWEAEIGLAVEMVFPPEWLQEILVAFGNQCPATRLQLHESVLSATTDRLVSGEAEVAITPHVPPGFLGEPLATIRFVAVAHPDHRLHALGRAIGPGDLAGERQFVVRDPGPRGVDAGWLDAERRWTVGDLQRSAACVAAGLGFAWLPEPLVAARMESGELQALKLKRGAVRPVQLFLVVADPDQAGPAVSALEGIIRETVARHAP